MSDGVIPLSYEVKYSTVAGNIFKSILRTSKRNS